MHAQLYKWLTREVPGQVHLIDFTTPLPTVSIPSVGYGIGGEEDINLMTDVNNNILFSTAVLAGTSMEVRDSNWNVMPNGSGLIDNQSSLENCIVRIPCTTNKYYIVHFNSSNLYYSIVDLTLNGGLGDVTNKNTLLGTGYTESMCVSQQMPTGCRWLLTSTIVGNSYEVMRFLITDVGIISPTVIATINLSQTPNVPHEIELSPNNQKVVMSTEDLNPADPDVIVWDFDLVTGTLTNQQDFFVSNQMILGVEFSPDNTKVYFLGNTSVDVTDFGRIDLTNGTSVIIDPLMGRYLTQVEKAANGKIYVSPNYNQYYIAEVANPNDPNIANIGYNHNAIFISNNGCRPGLPNAIEGELPGTTVTPQYIAFGVTPTTNCYEYQFTDTTCLATWWEWNFGDGSFSNLELPIHQYTSSGTYDITLRVVACGDTLTLTKQSLITISVSIPIAAFTADSLVCPGDSVLFTNSSTGAVSYSWNFGDSTISSASNPVHNFNFPGTYLVTLIASNNCTSDTIVQTIVVADSAISANFNYTIQNCSAIVTFTSLVTGATNLSWNFGDSSPTDTASNPVHNYSVAGTYTVTLIVTNECNSDTVQQQITIVISPVAVAQFTINNQPCDSTVSIVNLSQNAVNYQWNFGDASAIDTNAVPVHTYTSSGTYTITLIVSNSCSSDTIQHQVNILIPQPAIANFTFNSQPCSTSVTLNNQSQNALSYLWNFGDGSQSDTTINPSHNYIANGTYTITLIVGNICSSDTFQLQVTINIPLAPTANFTINTQPCNLNVTLTNTSQNGTGYQWDFGDGSISSLTNPPHTYASPGIYTITLITNNNCFSDTIQQQIDLSGAGQPVSDFTYSIPLCALTISLTNQSQNADSVWWDFGDGGTDTLLNPVHVYSTGGNYVITLISYNQCGSDTIIKTVIDTFSNGVAMFSLAQQPCKSEIQFTNQSQNAFSYYWNFGDGDVDTTKNPIHEYLLPGSYTITLIINQGTLCADTIIKIETINNSDTSNLFVPNCFTPNGDNKNEVLEISGFNECEVYHLGIYNRWGQSVYETDDIKKFWDGRFKNKDVPQGVYYFIVTGKLFSKNGTITVIR
ncbi:MAG TPA: PKD domain-containing protein [Bacteroidia bacterium]|nr:PKD domain-containing protein [Bacteroidia bacterium]